MLLESVVFGLSFQYRPYLPNIGLRTLVAVKLIILVFAPVFGVASGVSWSSVKSAGEDSAPLCSESTSISRKGFLGVVKAGLEKGFALLAVLADMNEEVAFPEIGWSGLDGVSKLSFANPPVVLRQLCTMKHI